jgi:glycosyltransferase involved in cell wall biosynthesis
MGIDRMAFPLRRLDWLQLQSRKRERGKLMKVVALVPNSGARDARVVKQARTLAAAGHEVHIVGVREPNHPSIAAVLGENILVHRLAWQGDAYRRALVAVLLRMALLALVFVVAATLLAFAVAPAIGALGQAFGSFMAGAAQLVETRLATHNQNFEPGWNWSGLGALVFDALVLIVITLVLAVGVFVLKPAKKLGVFWGVSITAITEPVRSLARFSKNYSSRDNAPANDLSLVEAFAAGNLMAWIGDLLINRFRERAIFRSSFNARSDALFRHALSLAPDLVYAHEVMTLAAGCRLKKALGCPLIYDAHEMYDGLAQAPGYVTQHYSDVHRRHIATADQMVVVSKSMAEAYIEAYGGAVPPTTVVANAVPSVELPPYDGRLHKAAGIPLDRKILLYQGGLAPNRGIEAIVQSARWLDDGWTVVVMGWGKLEATLKQQAERMAAEVTREKSEEIRRDAERAQRVRQEAMVKAFLEGFSPTRGESALQVQAGALPTEDKPGSLDAAGGESVDSNEDNAASPAPGDVAAGVVFTDGFGQAVAASGAGSRSEAFARNISDATNLLMSWSTKAGELKRAAKSAFNAEMEVELSLPTPSDFDKIRFVPPAAQEELLLWSQGATIGVIPYPNDGINHWVCSPNKLWEYSCAGVPVLVSPVIELYNFIQEYDFGWVLPPDPSPERIGRIVNSLDDGEVEAKRARTQAFIADHHWGVYAERLLEVVNSCAGGVKA